MNPTTDPLANRPHRYSVSTFHPDRKRILLKPTADGYWQMSIDGRDVGPSLAWRDTDNPLHPGRAAEVRHWLLHGGENDIQVIQSLDVGLTGYDVVTLENHRDSPARVMLMDGQGRCYPVGPLCSQEDAQAVADWLDQINGHRW